MRRERPSHNYKIVKSRVLEDSLPFIRLPFYTRTSRVPHPASSSTIFLVYLLGILRIVRVNRLTLYI